MEFLQLPSPLEELQHHPGKERGIRLFIKRDDLIHPDISGNKWRKLKYNIEEARNKNAITLVTAGGPWSNHLAATAVAGKLLGFKTRAFIRGIEPVTWSNTLLFCKEQGMEVEFLSKTVFDNRDHSEKIKDDEYYIPLGGENELGMKGCAEILDEISINFDIFSVPVGTGTTFMGVGNRLHDKGLIGFSALKSPKQHHIVLHNWMAEKPNVSIHYDRFGGFAKTNQELEDFIVNFQSHNKITLEPVYTGKMMLSLYSLIEKRHIADQSTIIVLHTGGLQGIKGFPDLHNRLFTS